MTWNTLVEAGAVAREASDALAFLLLPLILGLGIAIVIEAVKSLRARRLERFQNALLATGEPGSICPRCGRPEIVRTIIKMPVPSFSFIPAPAPEDQEERKISGRLVLKGISEKSLFACLNCKLTVEEPFFFFGLKENT